MRADAQRNREKILTAAREVFREQGYDASLDEVARRAGVGPGTLYRHFPRRETLLDALMQSWVERVETAAEKARAREGDPRDRLLSWLEDYVELISQHKGAAAKLTSALGDDASPMITKWKALASSMADVLEHEHEHLRDGVEDIKMCRLVGGVAVVADTANLPPEQVRAMLGVIVDGLLKPGV
ncbi:MAG: helix-turn-helix domain-containing protein [Kineosporiaceae bacterium]